MIVVTDNGPVEVALDFADDSTPPHDRLGVTWTGADGQTWDLTAGPAYLMSGARGFGMPLPQHYARESTLDGATWQGLRIPAREVFMPTLVKADPFMVADTPFAAGLDPRREGRLRVSQPDATWREIVCRYTDGGDGEYETDPVLDGLAVYPLRMTANDPYWRGEPVTARFAYPDSPPRFFTGPPFRLAPSEVLGASSITNPGDVDAYAVWRIEGPFSSFSVGIGNALVTMPLTKPLGGWVEVDMNPTKLTILDESGADRWTSASEVVFDAIPPGETTLTTVVTGAAPGSAVSVSFVPRYFRAW